MASTSTGVTYPVYRASVAGGPYTKIATTATPGYIDTAVTASTKYFYVVTALSNSGESVYSNETSTTVPQDTSCKGSFSDATPIVFNTSGTGSISRTAISTNCPTVPVVSFGVNQPWVRVSSVGPASPQPFTITANAAGLAPGTYNDMVSAFSPMSWNNTLTIPITLTVPSPTPTVCGFGGFSNTSFSGSSATSVSWSTSAWDSCAVDPAPVTLTSDQPWLKVTPSSGLTAFQISVTATAGTMAVGNYTGHITMTAPFLSNKAQITVAFTVKAPPTVPPVSVACTTVAKPVCTFSGMTSGQTLNATATDPSTGKLITFTIHRN